MDIFERDMVVSFSNSDENYPFMLIRCDHLQINESNGEANLYREILVGNEQKPIVEKLCTVNEYSHYNIIYSPQNMNVVFEKFLDRKQEM